jgi:hypothetical protein
MTQRAIKNEYEGPKKPACQVRAGQIPLDYTFSDDSQGLDTGIRETLRGVKLSMMTMGTALYRIEAGGLYIDLGFRKFGEYIDHLVDVPGNPCMRPFHSGSVTSQIFWMGWASDLSLL